MSLKPYPALPVEPADLSFQIVAEPDLKRVQLRFFYLSLSSIAFHEPKSEVQISCCDTGSWNRYLGFPGGFHASMLAFASVLSASMCLINL